MIGAGSVGAAVAYASMIDGVADEIALYDIDGPRARAEVLDLRHGLQFVGGGRVNGGDDIEVCADADLIVVTAGATHGPGGSRLDLAEGNAGLVRTPAAAAARAGARCRRAAGDEPGGRRHVRGPGDQRAAATVGSSAAARCSTRRGCATCWPSGSASPSTACTPPSSASTATARSCCGRRPASAGRRCSTPSDPTAAG